MSAKILLKSFGQFIHESSSFYDDIIFLFY